MQELDDNALLRDYAERASEQAFAAIVQRHINKVYSVSLRQTRNPHSAEEITQAVFVILAKKARGLGKSVVLSGWLYETARLTALTFIRSEIRRARREEEAYMQSLANEPESDAWSQISPQLDAAMGDLNAKDRNAIVLRFLDGKSMREVGEALGANEATARQRVNRAVEKLRSIFNRRGIILPAAVLTATISANSVQAAPAGLATAMSGAQGAAVGGSTLTLIKGALKVMAWTKAKTAIVIGAGVLLIAGTATVAVKKITVAHANEPWQEKYDLSLLETLPPQVKVRPSLPSTLQSNIHLWGGLNGKALGLGQTVPELFALAYGVQTSQLIWKVPVPGGKYDFIANLPSDNFKAAQDGLKETFSLAGRRVTMETNVLVLTVESRDAVGLKRSAGKLSGFQTPDTFSAHDQSFFSLTDYIQRNLGTVVIDQTHLDASYDIDFKWDSTLEGLQRVLRDELGLKLTPGKQPVKFVVVEKVK